MRRARATCLRWRTRARGPHTHTRRESSRPCAPRRSRGIAPRDTGMAPAARAPRRRGISATLQSRVARALRRLPNGLGSDDTITVRSLADAICDELGLADVEYRWTGGAGEGRGWAGDVRVMQLALDRIKSRGWRPRKTSEAAIRAAAKDVWASVGKPKPRA